MSGTIVWFRRDLRLADNPALQAAAKLKEPIIPVFIWAPEEEGEWRPGAASKWWLNYSLDSLTKALEKKGLDLVIRAGSSEEVLQDLIHSTGATNLFWNRLYEPEIIKRDTKIKEKFIRAGVNVESFNSALLIEPWEVKNGSGKPFQVFTPFWNSIRRSLKEVGVLSIPKNLQPYDRKVKTLKISDLNLLPKIQWDEGIKKTWRVGEASALETLDVFIHGALGDYADTRNIPSTQGTSRLSAHLHFGEISPRSIWKNIEDAFGDKSAPLTTTGVDTYLKELGWREFAHHLLFHFPHTPNEPLRESFRTFPWSLSKKDLSAWQMGMTGYPIVDAGMRELWHTGWMHNRVRMIVASFLVKDLRISWIEGAKWFWDTLVDASLANNTLGWQWTAGCGADAAPYFRVFNPMGQGEKFDSNCEYVRKWVPEISSLPDKYMHRPWEAEDLGGIKLGKDYPKPIVDHAEARELALRAFSNLKK